MAGNRFATMLHRHTHKITVIIVYAILEWILIGLLLLNSLFSYLIMRFANYFGLKPPCVLCCRVDHLFEPDKSKTSSSYTDLLCEHHSTEISKLGYCSNHRKLAESHHMCDDCSSSRPNSNANSIDISGRIAFFTWVKKMGLISSSGGCDDEKKTTENFLSRCSCCDVSISRELCSPCLLLKPSSWGVLDHYTHKGNFITTDDVSKDKDDGCESSDPCKSDCQTDRFDEEEEEGNEGDEEEEEEMKNQMLSDVEEKNYLRSPSSSRCGDIEMAEDDVVSTSTSKITEQEVVEEEGMDVVLDQFSDFKCIDDASIDMLPMNCFDVDDDRRFVPVELIDSMTLKKTQGLSGFEGMKDRGLDFESEIEKKTEQEDLHVENLIDFSDDDDDENLKVVESMEVTEISSVFPVLVNNGGELAVEESIDEATQTPPLCDDVEEVLVALNVNSASNEGNLIVFGDEPESGSFVERKISDQESIEEEPQAEEPISSLASTQLTEEIQAEEPISALASTHSVEEPQAEEPISSLASTQSVEEPQAEEPISALVSTHSTEKLQAEEPISTLASTHSTEELQAEEPISALAVTYSTEELQAEEPISALSNQQEDSSSTEDDCDEHDMSSDVLMAESENDEGTNQAEEVKTLSVELNRQLSIIPEYNEAEEEKLPGTPTYEEKLPGTPTYEENIHHLTRRLLLEKKESGGEESLDGSVVSEIESGEGSLTVEKLKTALKAEHRALSALYAELEEERSASAISANQTMAMITRLQEEKAAMQMEALQYQRMMEEQSEYDQEALQLLNELMLKREREKQELEKELEVYRKRVLHYEVKEKRMMMMRRKATSSGKSGASSVSSSNAADSEELSIDLNHEGPEEDSFYGHQDTPSDAVFNVEDMGLENSKQLSTLDESLADFEEERQSILEQLKALEEKLFSLGDNEEDEEELFEDIKPIEHFSEVSYEFNVQETNGVHVNGFSDVNSGKPSYKAKRLLPLFDATDMENEDEEMNEEHDGYSNVLVSRNSSVSKFSPDEKKLAIEEEVDHVYERLQALEADREFLKHCISSLKKGDKGMELLQEILQHLRDLRNVELRVKSLGDTSSVQ